LIIEGEVTKKYFFTLAQKKGRKCQSKKEPKNSRNEQQGSNEEH
jgi:hypothetical protein